MTDILHGAKLDLKEGDQLAAIDMGSNSFHMVVARYTLGELQLLDRIREPVRMAEGLDKKGNLSNEARKRATECLERFRQRLQDVPDSHIRAVATNTVRKLNDPQAFLMKAEKSLGHPIEVIAGREEARLVYLGVAHAQPPKKEQLRLVIDIGGGSTECIIGSAYKPIERESVQLGCVASTLKYFPNGKLSRKKYRAALDDVAAEFQQFAGVYRALGWDEAIGTSGTMKAVGAICQAMNLTKGAIIADALPALRDRMLLAESIDQIDLPGLHDDRRPVIAGGLLIVEAAFRTLGLERVMVSKAALREGVLYDMIERGGDFDPRDRAVDSLMNRFSVDRGQVERVEETVLRIFDQVAEDWQLDADDRIMVQRAARLHEIGLGIAHSGYHNHGAYIVGNADISGFSKQQQQFLSALVATHRRKVSKSAFDALPDRLVPAARRSAALLRLAVLFHRAHFDLEIPKLTVKAHGDDLHVELSKRWIAQRPLLISDLQQEMSDMKALGIDLNVELP